MDLKSVQTIETYRTGLNDFRKYLCNVRKFALNKITFDVITADLIREYLKYLNDQGKSMNTRNLRLTAIKRYISYCALNNIEIVPLELKIGKIKTKTVHPKQHNWMKKEQIIHIMNQCPRNRIGIRDRFIILFLFSTGVRVSELINCRINDLHLDESEPYVIITGKGNKTRIIPLTDELVENAKYYLTLYHSRTNNDDFLFYVVSKNHRCYMSEDNIQRIVKKYGDLARQTDQTIPEKVHPHLFRHSFGAINYRAGMSQPELAKLMGHSQIETTEIYAETDVEMIRTAVMKIDQKLTGEDKWETLTEDEKLKLIGLKK